MLPRNHPDRIRVAFDDRHQAAVNAGLLFPATQDLKHGVGLNHLPSGRFAANGAWLAVQSLPRTRYGVMAHNLARWTARIRSGRATGNHQDPPTTLLLPGRTAHPLGAPPHPASSPALALGKPVQSRPRSIASPAISGLTAPLATDPLTGQPIVPANSRQPSPRVSSAASHTAIPSLAAIADCLQHSKWRLRPAPDLPSGSDADLTIAPARPSISVPLPYHPRSVDSG